MSNTAALMMQAAGTGFQIGGQLYRGEQAEKLSEYEAKQYEAQAPEAVAAAQRQMLEQREKTTQVASRAQAIGAASGAGGVGLDKIFSDIEKAGEYRALAAKYQGDVQAKSFKEKAEAARYRGKVIKEESIMDALGTGAKGTYGIMKTMDFGDLGGKTLDDTVDPKTGWRTTTRRAGWLW